LIAHDKINDSNEAIQCNRCNNDLIDSCRLVDKTFS
jgi:hypothetical protein